MSSKSEKRKALRQDCRVPVESQKKSVFAQSQTVDICRGGAGLVVNKPIPVNTKMAVELDLNPEGESVITIGQVRWVQQLPGSNAYRLGMSFAEVEPDAKTRLNSYFK